MTIRKEGKTVYQKVLTGMRAGKSLKTWDWGFPLDQATYQALFPRAWTVYDIPEFKVRLTCAQISPVIPHDYKVRREKEIIISLVRETCSTTFFFYIAIKIRN